MSGSPWRLVRAFHESCDLPRADEPRPVESDLAETRQRLLEEEVGELALAVRTGHLPEIARELADVVYVAYGTAITYGIDLDAVLAEVHRGQHEQARAGRTCHNPPGEGPEGRPLPAA